MILGRIYSSAVAVMTVLVWTFSKAPTRREFDWREVRHVVDDLRSKAGESFLGWTDELSDSAYEDATRQCNYDDPVEREWGRSIGERIIGAKNPEGDSTEEAISFIRSWERLQDWNYEQFISPVNYFGCALVYCPAGTPNPNHKERLIFGCQFE